jgi:hypothetical protein
MFFESGDCMSIVFDYLYQFFLKIKDVINKDGGNDADRPEIREP